MKKLVYMFLLVGSLLIGANVVNAAGDGAKKNKAKMKYVSCSDQTAQIKSLIGSPDLLLNETTNVTVKFNISENNIVSVSEVTTENARLKQYVMQKLNGKRIDGNDVAMNDQTFSLVFKKQEESIFTIY